MSQIYKAVIEQLRAMGQTFRDPAGIMFNLDGYSQALNEDRAHNMDMTAKTYCGLPYRTNRTQAQPVRVLDSEQVLGGIRIKLIAAVDPIAARPSVDAEVVGRALTAPQLCDLIRGFLDGDDATHWQGFEKDLDRVVRIHGRFE